MKNSMYDTVIIGGGPAGTGLLLKALKDGLKNPLFHLKIALIEQSDSLVKGALTSYKINSDTLSDVFLECLEGATPSLIPIDSLKQDIEHIQKHKGGPIPLNQIEDYLVELGRLVQDYFTHKEICDFYMHTEVSKIIKRENNRYEIVFSGANESIFSRNIVVATGGKLQPSNPTVSAFAGKVDLSPFQEKIIHSDFLMKYGIPEILKNSLKTKSKVVILGGSHGGFSSAHILLRDQEFPFQQHDLTIWSTTKPTIYFPTKEEALESGYTEFTEEDICPITKRVFRLGGLRMDGRTLYMRMVGLHGMETEDRVVLKLFSTHEAELLHDLQEASLIILAFGYTFNMPPVLDAHEHPMRFVGEKTGHWVNEDCVVLDHAEQPIPGFFAIGLANGFLPSGHLGGEPSFHGQTNGIWYYQNLLAEQIINQL